MRVDDLRSFSLFDGLTDTQLAELVEAGTEVRIEPGVDLFHEGDHADFWWVLVDGAIDLMRHVGREDTVLGRMDSPGRWAGGFRAWDEHGVYLATGRGAVEGRVLRVPSEALRERATAWFPFGAHLIEGLYGTARTIESTARQRDSLVTLGTRAAGLAHEINNPPLPPPGRSMASRLRAGRCSRRSAVSPSARSRLCSSPRSTSCAEGSSRGRGSLTRWRQPTTRKSCRRGSRATASSASG